MLFPVGKAGVMIIFPIFSIRFIGTDVYLFDGSHIYNIVN